MQKDSRGLRPWALNRITENDEKGTGIEQDQGSRESHGNRGEEEQLRACYRSSLVLAAEGSHSRHSFFFSAKRPVRLLKENRTE